jgi:hypothetical protein
MQYIQLSAQIGVVLLQAAAIGPRWFARTVP